jgi:bifunctional non-homologous end joining protein LigD
MHRLAILISVPLPQFQPLPLSRARAPFSHSDWLFEIKWDGFRSLLRSDDDGVRLVSRNGNTFKSFPDLCEGLARDLRSRRCVLDGEIVCLDCEGKPQFADLLFRRGEPRFMAFDLLWDEHPKSDDEEEMRRFRNAEDTRYLPLIDRKQRLRGVVPKKGERLLYCDHIGADSERLFHLACENDLEGIVAKRRDAPYLAEHATWLKIRNQNYSQWANREELFERERDSNPDFHVWDDCALASEKIANEESRQRHVRSAERRSFFDRSRSRSTPQGVR